MPNSKVSTNRSFLWPEGIGHTAEQPFGTRSGLFGLGTLAYCLFTVAAVQALILTGCSRYLGDPTRHHA